MNRIALILNTWNFNLADFWPFITFVARQSGHSKVPAQSLRRIFKEKLGLVWCRMSCHPFSEDKNVMIWPGTCRLTSLCSLLLPSNVLLLSHMEKWSKDIQHSACLRLFFGHISAETFYPGLHCFASVIYLRPEFTFEAFSSALTPYM